MLSNLIVIVVDYFSVREYRLTSQLVFFRSQICKYGIVDLFILFYYLCVCVYVLVCVFFKCVCLSVGMRPKIENFRITAC